MKQLKFKAKGLKMEITTEFVTKTLLNLEYEVAGKDNTRDFVLWVNNNAGAIERKIIIQRKDKAYIFDQSCSKFTPAKLVVERGEIVKLGERAMKGQLFDGAYALYKHGKEIIMSGETRKRLETEVDYIAGEDVFENDMTTDTGEESGDGEMQVSIEAMITKKAEEAAKQEVKSIAKDAVDSYIRQEYGTLPKTIQVQINDGYVKKVSGAVHEKFETCLNIVAKKVPLFISGPAGSGKNVLCKQIADALGLDFYFSNALTQEYKLTGFIDANGKYHETQFYKAFVNGGLFMLDEIDASIPEVLVSLNAALANGYFDFPTGRVDAHEKFRAIAAGNTYGTGADIEYTGRYQLDAASLDRFAVIEIGYDESVELAISSNDHELCEFIHKFRDGVKKCGIKFVVSYRAIERIANLYVPLGDDAIKCGLVKGLDREDLRSIVKQMNLGECKYSKSLMRIAGVK